MSKKAGRKEDGGKPRMDLVPPSGVVAVAEILRYGAETKGYGDRNWEKGLDWGRVYGAAMRHLMAFWGGEDDDEESGLPHIWHAACNLFFLIEYAKTHPELDDRPTTLPIFVLEGKPGIMRNLPPGSIVPLEGKP